MTDLPINYNRPLIMHIDLNSCFAIIEQQANPLLRHKPVAIAAYDSLVTPILFATAVIVQRSFSIHFFCLSLRILSRMLPNEFFSVI
jgi:hypothetical protein